MTWLIRRLAEASAYGFAIIVLIMVYEVVARYLFGAPTFWAHEIAGLLGAVAFILGGAYCMLDGSHMRVTAFTENMPSGLKYITDGLALVCGMIYLGAMAFSGWQIAERSLFRFMPDGTWFPERSGSSWNTPLPALIKLVLFVGAVLFLAVVLQQFIAWLRGHSRPKNSDEAVH